MPPSKGKVVFTLEDDDYVYTYTGDIKDLKVKNEVKTDGAWSPVSFFYDVKVKFSGEFVPSGEKGTLYTLQKKPKFKPVKRCAIVEHDVKVGLEEARKRAGAPATAEVTHIGNKYIFDWEDQ